MILLKRDQINTIALTLTELSTPLLPNNWLFRFVLDQDDFYEYLVYLTDQSVSTVRYNLFYLDEGVDIDFKFLGDYLYEVYQMPDGGSEDFTSGVLVENGKMRLIEAEPTPDTSFEADTNTPIYDSTALP
jgi:hypothetical protein